MNLDEAIVLLRAKDAGLDAHLDSVRAHIQTMTGEASRQIDQGIGGAMQRAGAVAHTEAEKMANEGGERGLIDQLLFGKHGGGPEGIEHAIEHAFGHMGRMMGAGGMMGIGVMEATHAIIDIGKELWNSGAEADELGNKLAESMEKSREATARANDELENTVKQFRKIREESDRAFKEAMSPGFAGSQTNAAMVGRQADAMDPDKGSAFSQTRKALETEASDLDAAKAKHVAAAEADKAAVEKADKDLHEAKKVGAERAKGLLKEWQDNAAEVARTPAQEGLGLGSSTAYDKTMKEGQEAFEASVAETAKAVSELAEAARLARQKLKQDSEGAEALDMRQQALQKTSEDRLRRAQDLDKAAAHDKQWADNFEKQQQKDLKEIFKDQHELASVDERSDKLKERMKEREQERGGHFIGMEGVGKEIQAGLFKVDPLQKELNELNVKHNALLAQIAGLLQKMGNGDAVPRFVESSGHASGPGRFL